MHKEVDVHRSVSLFGVAFIVSISVGLQGGISHALKCADCVGFYGSPYDITYFLDLQTLSSL